MLKKIFQGKRNESKKVEEKKVEESVIEILAELPKEIKKSDNLEKLREQGQIEFSREYKSLEREAAAWEEGK